MKVKVEKISLVVVLLLTVLSSCTENKERLDSLTNSDHDSLKVMDEQIEKPEFVDTCGVDSILKNGDYLFSNQDTISLIDREQLLFPIDMKVKSILTKNKYGNYYYVSSYDLLENISMFTYFEDETEAPTVYLVTMNGCELISKVVVGFGSAWEHGNNTTKSVMRDDLTFEKISYSASKDWGDYTTWSFDTTITRYRIKENGFIEELN